MVKHTQKADFQNFTKSILKYLDPNIYVGIHIKVLEELERKKKAKWRK